MTNRAALSFINGAMVTSGGVGLLLLLMIGRHQLLGAIMFLIPMSYMVGLLCSEK